MANDFEAGIILVRDDSDRCILLNEDRGVDFPPVDNAAERGLCQTRADRRCDIVNSHRLVKCALIAVG